MQGSNCHVNALTAKNYEEYEEYGHHGLNDIEQKS